MKTLLIISQLIVLALSQSVNWAGNNWAMNCDFRGNDFKNVKSPGEQCGGLCAQTQGCTHFVWSGYQGGTCWMKSGSVCKNKAFYSAGTMCGVQAEDQGCGGGGGDGGSGGGGGSGCNSVFPGNRFKAGRSYDGDNQDYSQFDYLTTWIGYASDGHGTSFNPYIQGPMIDACNRLGKIPLFYSYHIAFEARAKFGFQDCDVNPSWNLCVKGAQYIRDHRAYLVSVYADWGAKIAQRLGRDKTAIFLIEPDLWLAK